MDDREPTPTATPVPETAAAAPPRSTADDADAIPATIAPPIPETVGGTPIPETIGAWPVPSGGSGLLFDSATHAPWTNAVAADRYEVLGEIARGGMGAVLRVHDRELNRELAVKVLLPACERDRNLVDRFVEEAQITGQLQHPGIPPVHERGRLADGRLFYAMKLVKGGTLRDLLHDRATPADDLPRCLVIFEQVAQTVAYAHSKRVIHRDLKPLNVMVGAFGEVQVMDWGLAKVLHDAPDLTPTVTGASVSLVRTDRDADPDAGTRADLVLGTIAYMPPEQAKGDVARVDRRADVFALGAILCQILTGEPPYTGRSEDELLRRARRGDTADALTRLAACGADPELVALAINCLAGEPADRPADAATVADRMAAHRVAVEARLRAAELARAAAEATAVEEAKRAKVERARRRLTLGLAASILALIALAGAGWGWAESRRREGESRAAAEFAAATGARGRAESGGSDPAAWADARAAADKAVAVARTAHAGTAALTRAEALAADVTRTADTIAAEAAETRRDHDLIEALADVRSDAGEVGEAGTAAAYARLLKGYGLDLGGDPAVLDAALARVAARPEPTRQAIVAALDDWAIAARWLRADHWNRPLATARRIDVDPARDRFRRIMAEGNEAGLRSLAVLPEDELDRLDPSALVLLAELLREPTAAVRVLRRGVMAHPHDVWVNLALAGALHRLGPAERAEALEFYRVARALRPATAHELAEHLNRQGRGEEAERVFRELIALRGDDARHLGCFGHLLKARGREAEAATILQRAVARGREAIRLRPGDAEAHDILGRALIESGDAAGAIAAFREAIRLRPNLVEAYTHLGGALGASGDAAGAIAAHREAIRLRPDFATAHANLGNALGASGDAAGAIAAHREAIRLRPDFATAHANLGNALGASGDAAGAIAAYREAVRLRPGDAEAHDKLGVTLIESGDAAGAVAALREAVRLRPGDAGAHGNFGVALARSGDAAGAVAALREAIRLRPGDALAHTNLGVALVDSGDVAGAIAAHREAIRLRPDHTNAHANLGAALRKSGDAAGAVAAYREAVRLRPDDAEAHVDLGRALIESGDAAGAVAALREAVRLRPDLAVAQLNLAIALVDSGDVAGAVAVCREAVRLRPGDAEAHVNLGIALVESGDSAGAIAAFREAIRLRPDFADAHFNLGVALRKSGNAAGAVAAYREAVRLRPDDAEAHCFLGGLLRSQGEYAESLAEYRTGHEIGSKRPDWRHPSARWVAEAEQLVRLASRLPAVLAGDERPSAAAEALALGQLCYDRRHHATAARLWADALEAEPALAESRKPQHRYNAACAAALAAAGKGEGEPTPDDAAKARLREQALGWLEAEQAAWAKLLATDPAQAGPVVQRTLDHWWQDADLAAIRDAEALTVLPEAERVEWEGLWAEVDRLRRAAVGQGE